MINEKYPNVEFIIYDIINNFFGKTITVAGLITGTDIVAQVTNPPKDVIIPATMLREFTDTMLDGMSVKELEQKLNAKVHVNHGPEDLIKIVGEISE
jgi:NifB/MoaA-like Fe-S oxidoreductase